MSWIAVDAGTSILKAVAFDSAGRETALARQKMDILRPASGFAEQSMQEVWNAVVATVRMVAAEVQDTIEGISVTAQGDGCWLVDANGLPVGDAILWNDARASAIVEGWRTRDVTEEAFRVSGSVPYAGLQSAIFHWLRENDPERLASARFAMSCNGWIFSKMTGRYIADCSDSSNPFSDVRNRCYSSELLQIFGAEGERRLLPEIARGDQLMGTLTKRAQEELGISESTPVVMAPYDIVSTAYGAGASSMGQACLILGTTICAETVTNSIDLSGLPAGTTLALEDGCYSRAMPTLTGCETLDWAVKLLGLSKIDELEALASGASPGAGGLIFLPYLSEAGERAPFLDPSAHGSFHGLNLSTRPVEVARAIYEGLSFVIRECLNAATERVRTLKVCGGGARSDLWCQMIADVTGIPVQRPDGNELGARGAFLFGQYITGKLPRIADGDFKYPVEATEFFPSPAARQRYERRFRLFRETRNFARLQWALKEELA